MFISLARLESIDGQQICSIHRFVIVAFTTAPMKTAPTDHKVAPNLAIVIGEMQRGLLFQHACHAIKQFLEFCLQQIFLTMLAQRWMHITTSTLVFSIC